MHPAITKAVQEAERLAGEFNTGLDLLENERAQLMKLSKKELVDRLLELKPAPKSSKGLIEKAAYAILCNPDCVWLDYGTIASIIRKKFPWAKTTEAGISWYSSKGLEKDQDVQPRKSGRAIASLILSEI